ncbi:MAG: alkaline phosphatase family protein, partial [Chloroflexota bacterium]
MSDQISQIAVIGLDGADWRLLQPWLDADHLPTLKKLIDQGSSGDLVSTIRPESSVAWSTFATGVNPGKHGIYGFMSQTDQVGKFQVANGNLIQANRFWDILGHEGKHIGLVNIPFTYPPRPVNGFMMTGMLTPNESVEFTYPAELKTELLEKFSSLLFDAGDDVTDKQKLLHNSERFTQQQ